MENTQTTKKWTVMVYMAGDNSLDPEGVKDLREMKTTGSTDNINVIAQFDRASGHTAKRYYIKQGGTVSDDAVFDLGNINTGDPTRLLDFIKWGVDSFKAQHYLLVLWNHGQGWDDTDIFSEDRFAPFSRYTNKHMRNRLFLPSFKNVLTETRDEHIARAILIDDDSKDFIDNQEMQHVLDEACTYMGRRLDVLGMDACLMSMAEVGYQIRNSTEYTVGSEQTEPGQGWPYDTILRTLSQSPDMSPSDLSSMIVDKYLESFTISDGVTLSACNLSKVNMVATTMKALASALTTSLLYATASDTTASDRIQIVRNQVRYYDVPDNVDLVDLCELMIQANINTEISSASQAVINAVNNYVIREGDLGDTVTNSNGVAIYFPRLSLSPLYKLLDWTRDTGWDTFLTQYLACSRNRQLVGRR
jgi:hypothetical protein